MVWNKRTHEGLGPRRSRNRSLHAGIGAGRRHSRLCGRLRYTSLAQRKARFRPIAAPPGITPPPYPRASTPCLCSPRCTRPRGLSRGIVRPGGVAGFVGSSRCGRGSRRWSGRCVPSSRTWSRRRPKSPRAEPGGARSASHRHLDIDTRHRHAAKPARHRLRASPTGAFVRNPAASGRSGLLAWAMTKGAGNPSPVRRGAGVRCRPLDQWIAGLTAQEPLGHR
jgi:hypothetical protein